MSGIVFQKVCVWSGMVCVTLFFAAFLFMHFIPPMSPALSAGEVAAHYREHTFGVRIGGLLMFVSSLFYAAFTAVMSAQMRRIPKVHPAAVYSQLAGGAFACITFMVPAMLFLVVAFRPGRDPDITLALNDMAWIFLVIAWPPFVVQNWSYAYAILSDGRERSLIPRWVGYLNIWAPFLFMPASLLVFFKTGPFAWNGFVVFWIPATVFTLQFIGNTIGLLRAVKDEQSRLGEPAPQAGVAAAW
jgi:hypothetical protein